MKKTSVLILILAMALPLAAADFGFTLDSFSNLEDISIVDAPPVGFTQIMRLSAFLSLKSGKAFRLNAAGYGDIGFLTFADPSVALNANLDRFEMAFTPLSESAKAMLAVRLGRLRVSDPATLVGIRRIDGLQIDFSKGQLDLGLDCGYLGLLSGQEMRILLSGSDIVDYEADRYLAPPRLYSALRARFVELFAGQDLQALVASQFDLRQGQPDRVHSEYAEILLEGPLAIGFDYQVGGVFELIHRLAETNANEIAGSAKLKLGWSEPAAANSKVNLIVDWASGTAGALSPYAPICSDTAGESFDAVFSSLLRFKLAYAFLPARGLRTTLNASGFMRSSVSDQLEDEQYILDSTQSWLGEEFAADLVWTPLSDLRFEIKGSCFLPARGVTFQPDTAPRWNASLAATINL
jgi:hypothetical protein